MPRTDAVVMLRQYGGGCDEIEMVGTESSYRRLGIELLRASFLSPLPDAETVQIDVDIKYLIAERSDVSFHMFHVDNALEPDATYVPTPRQAWKDKAAGFACGAVCLLLITVFGIGIVTVIQWMLR